MKYEINIPADQTIMMVADSEIPPQSEYDDDKYTVSHKRAKLFDSREVAQTFIDQNLMNDFDWQKLMEWWQITPEDWFSINEIENEEEYRLQKDTW